MLFLLTTILLKLVDHIRQPRQHHQQQYEHHEQQQYYHQLQLPEESEEILLEVSRQQHQGEAEGEGGEIGENDDVEHEAEEESSEEEAVAEEQLNARAPEEHRRPTGMTDDMQRLVQQLQEMMEQLQEIAARVGITEEQQQPRNLNEILATLPTTQIVDILPSHAWQCAVCLEAFEAGETTTTLPCHHVFHQDCIERWLAHVTMMTCPICRRSVLDNEWPE